MTILWHDITGYLADPTAVLATALLVCLSSQLCAVVIVLLKALLKLTGYVMGSRANPQSSRSSMTPHALNCSVYVGFDLSCPWIPNMTCSSLGPTLGSPSLSCTETPSRPGQTARIIDFSREIAGVSPLGDGCNGDAPAGAVDCSPPEKECRTPSSCPTPSLSPSSRRATPLTDPAEQRTAGRDHSPSRQSSPATPTLSSESSAGVSLQQRVANCMEVIEILSSDDENCGQSTARANPLSYNHLLAVPHEAILTSSANSCPTVSEAKGADIPIISISEVNTPELSPENENMPIMADNSPVPRQGVQVLGESFASRKREKLTTSPRGQEGENGTNAHNVNPQVPRAAHTGCSVPPVQSRACITPHPSSVGSAAAFWSTYSTRSPAAAASPIDLVAGQSGASREAVARAPSSVMKELSISETRIPRSAGSAQANAGPGPGTAVLGVGAVPVYDSSSDEECLVISTARRTATRSRTTRFLSFSDDENSPAPKSVPDPYEWADGGDGLPDPAAPLVPWATPHASTPKQTRTPLAVLPLQPGATPSRTQTVHAFKRQRGRMSQQLFAEFNREIFDNKLPADLTISWTANLTTTAGVTHYRRTIENPTGDVVPAPTYSARVELSCKVCGSCKSPLQFLGRFKPDGTPATKRKATGFSLFVADNFATAKAELGANSTHAQVMQELSRRWKAAPQHPRSTLPELHNITPPVLKQWSALGDH